MKQDPPGQGLAPAPEPKLALHAGAYLVSHPSRGAFEVDVYTAIKGAIVGRRVIATLVGPHPKNDFRAAAFWDDDARCATIWPRYKGPDSWLPLDGFHYQYKGGWSMVEQKLAIFLDLALRAIPKGRSHFLGEGYAIQRQSRCWKCNGALATLQEQAVGVHGGCA